jgi:transcriptional activator SPT8
VYSLAIQSQGIWLLSGLESGAINLQSIRHDCGKNITYLQKHTSAVSALSLAQDEKSVLSGSWDKNIIDWDLNTGQPKAIFQASAGQISAIETRPLSTLPVPEESNEAVLPNGTFSSSDHINGAFNSQLPNGIKEEDETKDISNSQPGAVSPHDSLFGDSLFGDDNGTGAGPDAPGDGFGVDDDDDEFSRAIANNLQQQGEEDAEGDIAMADAADATQPVPPPRNDSGSNPLEAHDEPSKAANLPNGVSDEPEPMMNGLPHAEETSSTIGKNESVDEDSSAGAPPTSDTTFLAASIDGTLRIWDKRQPNPVARILPHNVPPWCVSACWSPDGNHIYAGRRNAVVEEFSLHKGFRAAERSFRFPSESSSVTALKTMPNGRHLLW